MWWPRAPSVQGLVEQSNGTNKKENWHKLIPKIIHNFKHTRNIKYAYI